MEKNEAFAPFLLSVRELSKKNIFICGLKFEQKH
jgi:hypothetical protein